MRDCIIQFGGGLREDATSKQLLLTGARTLTAYPGNGPFSREPTSTMIRLPIATNNDLSYDCRWPSANGVTSWARCLCGIGAEGEQPVLAGGE